MIDVMACLPYDVLDTFSEYTTSYTDIFSILKVNIMNIAFYYNIFSRLKLTKNIMYKSKTR